MLWSSELEYISMCSFTSVSWEGEKETVIYYMCFVKAKRNWRKRIRDSTELHIEARTGESGAFRSVVDERGYFIVSKDTGHFSHFHMYWTYGTSTHMLIDQSVRGGWWGQYHIGRLHFPSVCFPGTKFRLGRPWSITFWESMSITGRQSRPVNFFQIYLVAK